MKPWITLWRSTCLKFRYAYCLQSWSPAGTASWRKRLRSCMFAHTCTYPHIHKDLCGLVYVNLFLNEFYINLKNRFILFYDIWPSILCFQVQNHVNQNISLSSSYLYCWYVLSFLLESSRIRYIFLRIWLSQTETQQIILLQKPYVLCVNVNLNRFFFLVQAEKQRPGKWKENMLYIAKVSSVIVSMWICK